MMGTKTLAQIRAELRQHFQAMGPDPLGQVRDEITEGGTKLLSEGSREILESLDRVIRNAEEPKPLRKRTKSKAKS